MKIKKLFLGFMLFFAALTQGWGASCGDYTSETSCEAVSWCDWTNKDGCSGNVKPETSSLVNDVMINEVSRENGYIELYFNKETDISGWVLKVNHRNGGGGTTLVECPAFPAGTVYPKDTFLVNYNYNAGAIETYGSPTFNCSTVDFHQTQNEVILFDSTGKLVHYVSAWEGNSDGKIWPFTTTDVGATIMDADIKGNYDNVCSLPDGDIGEPEWDVDSGCNGTPGFTNAPQRPTLSISDATVTEGNSGTQSVSAVISLSSAPKSDVVVNYTTRDGSAMAGSDYQTTSGSITFTPTGALSQTVSVKVFGDTKPEGDEFFYVDISTSSTAVTVLDANGSVRITDDDSANASYQCKLYDFSTALGSDWQASGSFVPLVENGRLKLMKAQGNQNSFVTQKNFLPPAKNKTVTVEFDFYGENGTSTPGDGIVVGLSDADVTPIAGGYGGSIGYAQRIENATRYHGFQGGWLGVAIDEYGNFSNKEGSYKTSGVGARKNSIAVRGSGDKFVGYDYIMGTDANIFGSTAGSLSSKRYRLKIDGMDENKTAVSVEVNKNSGNGYEVISMKDLYNTAVPSEGLDVSKLSGQAAIPSYFAVSFTSGTGGANRNYYIDNLEICSVSFPENQSDIIITDFVATPTSASIGDEINLYLAIKNYGPADTNDTITVTGLPKSSEWDIVEPLPSGYDAVNGTWTIGTAIADKDTRTLTLKIKAKTTGTKTITAVVNYTNEAEPSDNTKSVTIEIINNSAFDAWETTLTKNSAKLYTKVANQSFSLTIGTVDGVNFDGTLCAAVVSSSGTALSGGNYQCKDVNSTAASFTWSITQAHKVAMINIKSKNTTKIGGTVPENFTGYTDSNSSDTFAIKPDNFTASISPSPAKAGDSFTFNASNTTGSYNGNASITTATYNQNCTVKSGFLITEPDELNFATSSQTKSLISKDVGDINISIKDSTWTSVDQYSDCIQGSNSNTPDAANGQVGCDIETNATIKVIPYDINATNTNTNKPMWQYMSVDSTPKFGFSFDINATAMNGNKTSNFSSGCFADDVELALDAIISPSSKSLADINVSGATYEKGTNELNIAISKSSFSNGYASLSFDLNSEKSSTSPASEPINVKFGSWKSSTNSATYDNISSADTDATFLYGKIAAPNAMIDFNKDTPQTVRAYAQVYAVNSSDLPGSGWTNAPGSTTWWINKLDTSGGTPQEIVAVLPRASTILKDNNTANTYTGIATSVNSNIFGGIGEIKIDMSGATNKDQQIKLHIAVPEYLWYGTEAYDFSVDSDCTKHPCMSVDIFGITGSLATPDKAIKTIRKGKRMPRANH